MKNTASIISHRTESTDSILLNRPSCFSRLGARIKKCIKNCLNSPSTFLTAGALSFSTGGFGFILPPLLFASSALVALAAPVSIGLMIAGTICMGIGIVIFACQNYQSVNLTYQHLHQD